MSSGNSLRDRSLHNLLEGLVKSQRQDIQAYSGGHLNEANLWTPQGPNTHKPWRSSKKTAIVLQPPSHIPRPSKDVNRENKMTETVAGFSLGTTGRLPKVAKDRTSLGTRGPVAPSRSPTFSSQGSYTKLDDGVLVEEIKLAETMVTNPTEWDTGITCDQPASQESSRNQKLGKLKQQFIPGYMDGVTKKDQYNNFKDFESKVLRKQDATEQNVLTGINAVEHLENKLQTDLLALKFTGFGPSFHRLQVYSNVFDDMVKDSTSFGYILKTIKREYDNYVAKLLDGQTGKHRVLYDQVDQLSTTGASNPHLLQHETRRVQACEQEARFLLHENERLRAALQDERDHVSQTEPEPTKTSYIYREEPQLELSEQVEELHGKILEKLDAINEMRRVLRTEFVPSSVCTHLQQCIKETEVEIQKLQSQREYFERSTTEMEKELQDIIENADTTERDARRVWKKVSAVKSLEKSRGNSGGHKLDENDEDDEIKWNWYIS